MSLCVSAINRNVFLLLKYNKEGLKITSICLVRHGETDWNALGKLQGRTDIPLNSNGILQAEECSQFLSSFHWDVIITSPLKRAKETAIIIKKGIEAPLVEMDEFLERHFGDAEGMTAVERLNAFPTRIYPNQEEWESLKQRILAGLEKIHQNYPRCKVLLVAHGAVINAILSHFSNGDIGSGKTKLINACISNIEFSQEEWSIIDYNQVAHLSHYG